MKDLFLAFLSKTLNMDSDSVAEKLFKKSDDDESNLTDELLENSLETLLELDAERVKTLKGSVDTKTLFDNGYKKGQKEALEKLEKDLKSSFKIESEKQGLDLVKEVLAKTQKNALSDDKVKLHPLYLDLEETKSKELNTLKSDFEKQIEDLKNGFSRESTVRRMKSKALEIFDALNPVLPKDAHKSHVLKSDFADLFSSYDYETLEDGRSIPIRDGKRLEDRHGNLITFDQLVKAEAEKRFDFVVQDNKGNAGNQTSTTDNGFAVPKSLEERDNMLANAKTSEERLKIADAWEKSQSN